MDSSDSKETWTIMPRIDDYLNAKKLAIEELSRVPFETILKQTDFESSSQNTFRIPFLDRVYQVAYPQFEFEDSAANGKDVPLQEQVLILHYMMAKEMPSPASHWISYREIPGAGFYFGAFVKRAVEPLKKVFGSNIDLFSRSARKLNAAEIDNGDAGFEIRILPAVPLQLIIWSGDDEFPPEANILFDKNIGQILSPEDVAWLAGMVVYRLIGLAR
jgi:hypothetical protein